MLSHDAVAVAVGHRLWFAIEPEGGDLFLIEQTSDSSSSSRSSSGGGGGGDSSSAGGGSSDSSSAREGLPAWIGADIPVIPAACSAAASGCSRVHVAKLLEECCCIKVSADTLIECVSS
jgi:hypothetical protein